jgi:hypothetical protein
MKNRTLETEELEKLTDTDIDDLTDAEIDDIEVEYNDESLLSEKERFSYYDTELSSTKLRENGDVFDPNDYYGDN